MKCAATSNGPDVSAAQKGTGRWVKLLGLVLLVTVFNGCASRTVPGGADQWSYNAYTGYPAILFPESTHR